MKTAVIYARVSTLDQDTKRQIKELKDYAKYAKYKPVEVFEEKISGAVKGKERPEFKRLLEFVEVNKVDTILCWELSRIGRDMEDVVNHVNSFARQGINIYCKKENLNTLDEDGNKSIMTNIIIAVLSGFSEMERETTRKRIVSGLKNSVAQGGAGSSLLKPYGYANVNRKLVIDTDESKIVQLIFQKYLEGLGTQQIAGLLNQKQIPTRFNKSFGEKIVTTRNGYKKKGSSYTWKDGTIYSILNNTIYYGDRRYKNEIYAAPAIITKETFDLCQSRLRSNYNKPNSEKKYENILGGLIICPRCGKNYFMHKRADNSDNAYKCISKRYNEYCGNPSVNIDKLNSAVYFLSQDYIFNEAIQSNSVDVNLKVNIENKEIELNNIKDSIEQLERRLKNDLKHLRDELITATQFKELKYETEIKIEKLNEKLVKVTAEKNSLQKLSNAKTDGKYDFDIFKKYVHDAIEYIKIHQVVDEQKLKGGNKTEKAVWNRFKELYGAKNDIPVLIEMKSSLVNSLDQPLTHLFMLTRYSKNFGRVDFDFDTSDVSDFKQLVEKRNYNISHVESTEVFELDRIRPKSDRLYPMEFNRKKK